MLDNHKRNLAHGSRIKNLLYRAGEMFGFRKRLIPLMVISGAIVFITSTGATSANCQPRHRATITFQSIKVVDTMFPDEPAELVIHLKVDSPGFAGMGFRVPALGARSFAQNEDIQLGVASGIKLTTEFCGDVTVSVITVLPGREPLEVEVVGDRPDSGKPKARQLEVKQALNSSSSEWGTTVVKRSNNDRGFFEITFRLDLEPLPNSTCVLWSVSESQPDIPYGGRVNTIAIHPTNNKNIFVASESGGLFGSIDGGASWKHVDSLPVADVYSVAYVPASPNILIATASVGLDFKTTDEGGIWRSTDGGTNWAQASLTLPPTLTDELVSKRLSAHEISIALDTEAIYVATEYGAFMSADQGANWTHQDVFGSGGKTVSILALGGNRVLAGGPSGIRRSTDGGTTWTSPATEAGSVGYIHSFGRSPLSKQHAYVVTENWNLFRTEDAGDNWEQIASAPVGGGACGGLGFIKVVAVATPSIPFQPVSLHLYFSNRCGIARLVAPFNVMATDVVNNKWAINYGGTWQTLGIDHPDTRDLAFDNAAKPFLLGTDGGLHKTNDGGDSWKLIGGLNGYNALQIYDVKGQYIEDISRYDLYFGTQDNELWASKDGGATWINSVKWEGGYIEAERRVATESHSKITFRIFNAGNDFISDPLFTNVSEWKDPPGAIWAYGSPMLIKRSTYIQPVNSEGGLSNGLAITNNLGSTWQQFAAFPEVLVDMPKLGRAGTVFPPRSTIVYQPYSTSGMFIPSGAEPAFEKNFLMRIRKTPLLLTVPVLPIYPAMNNFSALGIQPTMFKWYHVYGIDPADAFHLIAPDVGSKRMMETHDGGENWTEIPGLTDLVTDNGRLVFSRGINSIITAISFSPQNPQLVLAGAYEGGIYFSADNGASWHRIPQSERITRVTSFEWRNADDVIVSTYGRGLWRLQNRTILAPLDFERNCLFPCTVQPFRPTAKRQPIHSGILIYGGKVLGAKAESGLLREVFVTRGSSVVFIADNEPEIAKIKITRTNRKVGFQGLQVRPAQRGWIIKGLVFSKGNRLTGAVFGDKEMVMTKPESPRDVEGSTKSPTAGKPYLRLIAKDSRGPTATPNESIQILGTSFPHGVVLEIFIDDRPTGLKVQVDGQGNIETTFRAPREMGVHSLDIRTGRDKKSILDGSMFIVRSIDEFKLPPR